MPRVWSVSAFISPVTKSYVATSRLKNQQLTMTWLLLILSISMSVTKQLGMTPGGSLRIKFCTHPVLRFTVFVKLRLAIKILEHESCVKKQKDPLLKMKVRLIPSLVYSAPPSEYMILDWLRLSTSVSFIDSPCGWLHKRRKFLNPIINVEDMLTCRWSIH